MRSSAHLLGRGEDAHHAPEKSRAPVMEAKKQLEEPVGALAPPSASQCRWTRMKGGVHEMPAKSAPTSESRVDVLSCVISSSARATAMPEAPPTKTASRPRRFPSRSR
jgi:hypothetical protein